MYQTVTIRVAASSQQDTAFQTMCTLVGRVGAIDEMPRHGAGAARAIWRPRRLHDDTPVKTLASPRLEPAHARVLQPRGAGVPPRGAGVMSVAGATRCSRRLAHAGACPVWRLSGISFVYLCPCLWLVHPCDALLDSSKRTTSGCAACSSAQTDLVVQPRRDLEKASRCVAYGPFQVIRQWRSQPDLQHAPLTFSLLLLRAFVDHRWLRTGLR